MRIRRNLGIQGACVCKIEVESHQASQDSKKFQASHDLSQCFGILSNRRKSSNGIAFELRVMRLALVRKPAPQPTNSYFFAVPFLVFLSFALIFLSFLLTLSILSAFPAP